MSVDHQTAVVEKKSPVKVPYLDLSVHDPDHKAALLKAVDTVLSHGRVVMGPEHDEFERRVADFCQKKYGLGISSGTDALYFGLRSLDLSPGDEVITTSLSWVATANAIALCGATPVFVDVREDLNIDPDRIEEVVTPRTKVILPVHFSGKLCDMDRIQTIADHHHLTVVEDAAQAFGSHSHGRLAGSFGLINSFSMNAMKVFCAYGDAGALVTDDAELYEKVVSLRYNGTINKEECRTPSLNGRLDTLQAAMMLVNFERLTDRIEKRRRVAEFYTQELGSLVQCPREDDGYYDVYYTYAIITDQRDKLRAFLEERGIETKIHHPIPMPHQEAYEDLPKRDIPVVERLVNQILSIPNHQDMTQDTTAYVVECIKGYFGAG